MSFDQGFPILEYSNKQTPFEWGVQHGTQFKKAIHELAKIRKDLMLMKNPALGPHLEVLAKKQAQTTKEHAPLLWEELEGVAKGADLSLTDLVILNNYTDFRDIQLPDEGCTTALLKAQGHTAVGQTWDMHSSAKDFLCVLNIPRTQNAPACLVLTLVGCTGLMAVNEYGVFLGVNNINTKKAEAGLIWPTLVRKAVTYKNHEEALGFLSKAPVTSGHNYLLSDKNQGGHYEVSPKLFEQISFLDKDQQGLIFHTNHCLGKEHKAREDELAKNSTSQIRYDIVNEKKDTLKTADDLTALFKDHTNYPKSICSHFQSGAQDPSMTCGSGVVDYNNEEVYLWRGCEKYDKNYVDYRFQFPKNEQSTFHLMDS